ncbi:MAG TPA: hypothetical protein VLE26_04975 [Alphaproteobacteria bacterium]|jgi:hypothetical protein|nr:hypothetical protein [Alphaproteobacteria bacterium]
MPVEAVQLVAMLVTATVLGYSAAIALAGVQFIAEWRTPRRSAAIAGFCQHAGAALALLGLVYRNQEVGTVGLLLVMLSVLVADVHRPSPAPKLEIGLTVLAMANLVSVVALLTA